VRLGNVFDHVVVELAHPQIKEKAMSSTTDKLKGTANQVAGKVNRASVRLPIIPH